MFTLSDKESKEASDWINSQLEKTPAYSGAAGGRFSYEFTPTGLGMCIFIIDNITKERKDVTDFSDW